MKRIAIAAAIALAGVSLAACSGCSSLNIDRGALTQTVLDEKGLYAAEAGLFGANTAAEAAVDAGLLTQGSPTAIAVADGLDKAHAALLAARAARRVGDAHGLAAQLSTAQAFLADAWRLIPSKKELS